MSVKMFRTLFKNQRYFRSRSFYTYSKEPAYPIDRKPEYVSADEALDCTMKSGDTVFVQGAAATPICLVHAMTEVGKRKCLKNVKVCHMHTEGPAPYTEKDCEDKLFETRNGERKFVTDFSGHYHSLDVYLSLAGKQLTMKANYMK